MSDIEDFRGWLQDYSKRLAAFFESTARLDHVTTIGDAREADILKFLVNVLPESAKLIRTPTVINRDSVQSPSFDGVFYDPRFLPRFFVDSFKVLFLDSVCLMAEVKSKYGVAERDDVSRKVKAFEQMYDSGQRVAPSFCFFYKPISSAAIMYDYIKRLREPQPIPYITTCLNKWVIVSNKNIDGFEGVMVYEVGYDTLLLTTFLLCEEIQKQNGV